MLRNRLPSFFLFRDRILKTLRVHRKIKRNFLIGILFLGLCTTPSSLAGIPVKTAAETVTGGNVQSVDNTTSLLPYMATEEDTQEKRIVSVPYISQEHLLPTGCEIISAVMLLRFYGYTTSVDDFVDHYLVKQDLKLHADGQLYGAHPASAFIGDPYRGDGLGCYAPVIRNSLSLIVSEEDTAVDLTGTPMDTLAARYIKNGTPVLVWASVNMQPLKPGGQWIVEETGEMFTWLSGEHCLVLVGYDRDNFYFNDPYRSQGLIGYDKGTVRERYRELGNQSVAIFRS